MIYCSLIYEGSVPVWLFLEVGTGNEHQKKTSLFFLVVKTFYMESFVGWFPTVLFRRPAAEEAWNAGAL